MLLSCTKIEGAFRSPGENGSSIYEMASRACFKNRLVSTGGSPAFRPGSGVLEGPRKSDFHQPGFSRNTVHLRDGNSKAMSFRTGVKLARVLFSARVARRNLLRPELRFN